MSTNRSPRYPYFGLDEAVSRTENIYDAEGRAPFTKGVAAAHLGYKSFNGSAAKALSALKKYGLIEKTGKNFKLTDDAVTIIVGKHADDASQRREALRNAATRVSLFKDLLEEFGTDTSEANLIAQLQMRNFSKDGAAKAAKSYFSTMNFIEPIEHGENDSPNTQTSNAGSSKTSIKTGDSVQWKRNGRDVFDSPATVLGLSDDGQETWVFTDKSENGLPSSEIFLWESKTPPPSPPLNPFTESLSKEQEKTKTEGFNVFLSGKLSSGTFKVLTDTEPTSSDIRRMMMLLKVQRQILLEDFELQNEFIDID